MGNSSEPYLLIFISEGRGNNFREFIVETKISAKRFTVCRRISFLNWRIVLIICLTYHICPYMLYKYWNFSTLLKEYFYAILMRRSTQFFQVEIRIRLKWNETTEIVICWNSEGRIFFGVISIWNTKLKVNWISEEK